MGGMEVNAGTNTLAYFYTEWIAAVKSFIVEAIHLISLKIGLSCNLGNGTQNFFSIFLEFFS